ncbi:MAG: hypothetical protein IPH28_22165 [Cytophagaceae bacterium]|nr:hypothetical protein [Cytophagaceae bacterium]MBK9933741.1 hypothetical protein [Cytophagaceae bacterium]MBL0302544.1 hypothetical protein [Cytophagaceae bacterium]MBL0325372.1 hypothetical protein [Cytophagaceae bacterium]
MKVLVEISDKNAEFGLEVLKSLSFVKKTQQISKEKARLWSDLKQAAQEIKLHQEGKINLKSARELLNEL